jgi:hypothetical protein
VALVLLLPACGRETGAVSRLEGGVCREALVTADAVVPGSDTSSGSEDSDHPRGPQFPESNEISAAELAEAWSGLALELDRSDEVRFEPYRDRLSSALENLRSTDVPRQQEAMDRTFLVVNELRGLCTVDLLRDMATPS